MAELNPTTRFSDRVAFYVKYRPGYPQAIIPFLQQAAGLLPASVIADVGSGTGKLAEIFLQNGNVVYGVEPNQEMREAGEAVLAGYPRFRSVVGTAEATTLPDSSMDFVTAGQAFHWFDLEPAQHEFRRILRPGGTVVLVWNERKAHNSPFLQSYETLVQQVGVQYHEAKSDNTAEAELTAFFAPSGFAVQEFDHGQVFDWQGLRGRLLSSSYAPLEGHPNHEPMVVGLRRLFEEFQSNGVVTFPYTTQVYYGRLM